jgi:hypothetical protein
MSYGWYYSPGKDQAGAPAEAEAAAATEGEKADAAAVRAGPVSYGTLGRLVGDQLGHGVTYKN